MLSFFYGFPCIVSHKFSHFIFVLFYPYIICVLGCAPKVKILEAGLKIENLLLALEVTTFC